MLRFLPAWLVICVMTLAQSVAMAAIPLLVDPPWLLAKLNVEQSIAREHRDPHYSIVIVDTREAKEYNQLHIATAVNVPVTATFSGEPRKDLVAPISVIQKLFSNAGISPNTHVVVYDNGNFTDAARVFWVLEVYGHEKVSMLDGGFAYWKKMKLPVSDETHTNPPRQFIPGIVPERLSTMFATRLAMNDTNKVLIDARSPDEYQGKKSKTARKGHIPTAISIPANENYYAVEEGVNKIKPLELLRTVYNNIDPQKNVITYCNRGRESALTYFVLRQLGYSVSSYDGSWYEWSSDASLPIINPSIDPPVNPH